MGSIDGVYATSAAWRGGHEVVRLLFDPDEISYRSLVEKAKKFRCTATVYAHSAEHLKIAKEIVGSKAEMADRSQRARPASAGDQLYHLAHSPLKAVPMCAYQRMKVNAAIGLKDFSSIKSTLSPRQIELARLILANVKPGQRSFENFVTPTNSNDLGAYTAKLRTALAKASKAEE